MQQILRDRVVLAADHRQFSIKQFAKRLPQHKIAVVVRDYQLKDFKVGRFFSDFKGESVLVIVQYSLIE